MNNSLKNEAKKIVNASKEKNRIKSYKEAFKDFPTNKETHKGDKNYYLENR